MHKQHMHHAHAQPAHTEGNLIRWARYYDPLVKLMTMGRTNAMRQRTADLAHIQTGDKVLDVGCGTGDLTMAAKERAGSSGQVMGIDPSPEMIAVARQKAEAKGRAIDYRIGVIEALPFAENSFDVVLSSFMMHHLPDHLKTEGLTEIQRVLRPNGHLLIVDFRPPDSLYSKFFLTLFLHGGMQSGLTDLPAKVEMSGFHNIRSGKLNMLAIGYLSAQANKATS
jgi:ubiquinone/menaquinone biosynthesis C-methylase UbiE